MSIAATNRRRFIQLVVLGAAGAPLAGALLAPRSAQAQELPHLEESDPTAAALGYRHDTTKVDQAKYPAHTNEQACANCNLLQGKDGDAWRPCAIFPGKAVGSQGWCAAWVKKA
jgi:hypothetical protein